MSFTVKVKEELLSLSVKDKNELAAIIKMAGSLGISSTGLTLSISTENAKIARHLYELLSDLYQVKSEIRHHQKTNLRKNRVYTVFLDQKVEGILSDLHLADSFFGIEAGIDQAKAGLGFRDFDKIPRDIIIEAGYGDYFTHGIGHGIGLDIHEEPYFSQTSKEVIKSGMVLTDEPGIYIEGKYGVRIEDDILITDTGCELLTLAPKELIVI